MIYILIVVVFVITEHKIKTYMEEHKKVGEKQEILGGRIIIQKQYNEGAMLNFLENKKEIVKTISGICLGLLALLFAITLPKKGNKLYKLSLSLMLGGAFSNVYDRFRRGHVIDYFTINYKKLKTVIFNLADIAIFIGAALMMIASFISAINQGSGDKPFK